MIAGNIVRFLGPAMLAASALSASLPTAAAQPNGSNPSCPDVQVLFARGTYEAPGLGHTGQAFVDSLRPRLAGHSMQVYPINYPASREWATGVDGIRDAGAHVESTAANCPKTKMVLSGYSQGAAVMGFVTSAAVPDGIDPATVPHPLAPAVADHVAAVVLFGSPNVRAMNFLGEPPVVIGPAFTAKTIQVCAPEDPVCGDGMNFAAHDGYTGGMIDQGADFAASRINGTPAPAAPGPHGGFGS